MKSILQLLSVSVLAFGLSSCDPFEGVLKVQTAFKIKSTFKTVEIPVGTFNAEVDFTSTNKMKIKVADTKATITLPENTNIPSNGDFMIPSQDINQTFSAKGNVNTKSNDSQSVRDWESCTYTRYEVECSVVNNQTVCREVPRQVQGRQNVEYYNRSTAQSVKVSFVTDKVLATFTGNRNWTEKVYTYRGQCF